MSKEIELEINADQLRLTFLKYTKKAFEMLPQIDKPRILDIGCGSGVPTLELSRLSNGEIIGIDIDQTALDELNKNVKKLGLSNRVKAIKCSLFELEFPDESFDIIWGEGVLAPIGFERALKEWRRLLKINGFMVLHDDLPNKERKLKIIPECGYVLVNHFQLPDDAWWTEYYEPLEKRINDVRAKYKDDPKVLEVVNRYQNEINKCKKNPRACRSIFYIIQKTKEP
ncbi:MAG: class I SAM-dependent methyltransferase [Promethearchaeota archaeon]